MDRQVPVLQRASFGYLARHPWQLLLALTGICIGVAVMVAVDLANESSRRAFLLSMDAVNGEATHQVVAGPAGIDEQLYVALRVEKGLRNLAPVVEGYVDVGTTTLHLLGIDPFAERGFRDYTLQGRTELEVVPDRDGQGAEAGFEEDLLRRMLTEPGVVLLARETAAILGIAPGDAFGLVAGGKSLQARVAGLLGDEGDNDASRRNLLIADIATAQQWLGLQGRLSRIDVRIEGRPGEDAYEKRIERIEAALPKGTMMLPAEARSRSVSEMSEAFMTNLTAMSLLALLIGVFLIYNSVSFAVVQRRSLVGVLRALGVTRSEAFRLVLFEALLLGIAGAAVGLAFGSWLGERLLALVSRSINDLYYVVHATDIALDPFSMARGFAIGVGATLLAALVPAAEAASFRPRLALSRSVLEARSGHAVPRVAAAGGAIVIAGMFVLAVSGTALVPALVAVFMLVFGLALAVPLFVRGASGVLAPLAQGIAGTGARLAVAGIGRSLSRTGVAIVALAVAVSATIGVSIMVDSFRGSVRQWLDDTLQSDIYVSVARGTLDPAVVDELLKLPQVEDHSTSRRVWLETGSGRIRLTAIAMAEEGYAGKDLVGVDPERAWRAFEDGAILVSGSFAWRHGVAPGDRLTLPTPAGDRDFPVAATYRSYDADLDAVLMSRATYLFHWRDPRVNSLGIYLADGADVHSAIEQVRAVSRGRQALLVNSNRELRERSMQVFERTFVITDVLYWLAVSVAAVGILSAMLALQLERAREFAVFRALGMTPGQLGRMVVLQTAFIGLLSGLAAIPLGLTMAWVLVDVINRRAFGWQMDLTISPSVLVAAVGLAVVTAVVSGLYPAWRAAGARPALAMREE